MKKIYLIKNISSWMLDELFVLAKETSFTLILLRGEEYLYKKEIMDLERMGIEIKISPFKRKINLKKLLYAFKFLVRNLKRFLGIKNLAFGLKSIYWFLLLDEELFEGECLIHSQFATQSTIIAFMFHEFSGCKFSFTFHAYDIFFKNKWFKKLVQKSDFSFTISVFNQRYVKEKYKISNEATILSRLGVFLERNQEIRSYREPFRVGFISWFNKKKGLNYLMKAIKSTFKTDSSIVFELAGTGKSYKKVKNWVSINDFEEKVILSGNLSGQQKKEFFQRIDCLVLPSIQTRNDMDGIPVVLMEAISYGLPIISTNISGIPEICLNNINGFLIEEKNEEAIKYAILNLKTQKHKYSNYSKNALSSVLEYDIEKNTIQKFKKAGWIV